MLSGWFVGQNSTLPARTRAPAHVGFRARIGALLWVLCAFLQARKQQQDAAFKEALAKRIEDGLKKTQAGGKDVRLRLLRALKLWRLTHLGKSLDVERMAGCLMARCLCLLDRPKIFLQRIVHRTGEMRCD